MTNWLRAWQGVGDATVVRNADGTRGVECADPLIAVSAELLASPDLDPDFVEPDGTLRLDTAGEYRYRYVRDDTLGMRIYERIGAAR